MSLIQFYKRANPCDNFVHIDWHLERRGEVGELGWTEEGGGGEGETPLGRQKYETEKGRNHWGGKNMKQRKWALFFTDIHHVVVSQPV